MSKRNPTGVWIVRRQGKRGVSYRLRWIDPRNGLWQSEPCGRDLAYARQRRDQVRQEIREGLSGRLPETTLDALMERLPAMMAGKSPETVRKTQDSLQSLRDLCGVGLITGIDRAVVMDFRAKRLDSGISPATVNKDLRQIRSALSYAMDAGLLRQNPLLRWKGLMVREPEKVVRVIEREEFARLLAASENPSVQALLVVGYREGLRRRELANLRWAAVDLGQGVLHVVNVAEAGELTKSRRNRSLPMHPDVREVLSAMWEQTPKMVENGRIGPRFGHVFTWPDGTRFKPDWLTHEFARLGAGAGIAHCTMHDLRRSFSTIAQRAGVDRHTVKDLGGWSSVSVVERHYTGEVSEVYRQAMDKIAGTA